MTYKKSFFWVKAALLTLENEQMIWHEVLRLSNIMDKLESFEVVQIVELGLFNNELILCSRQVDHRCLMS